MKLRGDNVFSPQSFIMFIQYFQSLCFQIKDPSPAPNYSDGYFWQNFSEVMSLECFSFEIGLLTETGGKIVLWSQFTGLSTTPKIALQK